MFLKFWDGMWRGGALGPAAAAAAAAALQSAAAAAVGSVESDWWEWGADESQRCASLTLSAYYVFSDHF